MNYEFCPKCDGSLNILQSSGRQICSSCKWTEPIEKTTTKLKKKYFQIDVEENQPNTEEISNDDQQKSILEIKQNSGSGGAVVLFVIGFIMMLSGLFYDTTTCSSSYGTGCTHNIGLIHESSNILNFGGFLCICGCVLNVKPKKN
ncbi:MAG: hypothetical protein QNJ55_25785 [Xenococcus sp. MO_188.B8]|nr:hypothetical protein [Xenococcus sp. MO_188.B8]